MSIANEIVRAMTNMIFRIKFKEFNPFFLIIQTFVYNVYVAFLRAIATWLLIIAFLARLVSWNKRCLLSSRPLRILTSSLKKKTKNQQNVPHIYALVTS